MRLTPRECQKKKRSPRRDHNNLVGDGKQFQAGAGDRIVQGISARLRETKSLTSSPHLRTRTSWKKKEGFSGGVCEKNSSGKHNSFNFKREGHDAKA